MHDPTAAPAAATTAEQASGEAFPSWLALLIAVLALGAGLQLVAGESKDSIAAGMLLLVTALAFTAVALAQGAYGPDAEGPLDLSARLGLGFLGGILGAMAARLIIWLTAEIGLLDLLGIHIGWENAILLGLAPPLGRLLGHRPRGALPLHPGFHVRGKGGIGRHPLRPLSASEDPASGPGRGLAGPGGRPAHLGARASLRPGLGSRLRGDGVLGVARGSGPGEPLPRPNSRLAPLARLRRPCWTDRTRARRDTRG